MFSHSHALCQSLIHGPLLIGDLPEASTFPRDRLRLPHIIPKLDLEQKLGHLYEDAMAVLLEESSGFELLARNLQLQEKTTLGEIDFLVRDLASQQLIHLELATKFYLGVETKTGLALPGPDPRDNYSRKIQRLRTHQLTLVRNHRNSLPESFRTEPITVHSLVYGCLFDHVHAPQPAHPEFIYPHCRRGQWLTIDECADHFHQDSILELIPKSLWPVSFDHLEDAPLEKWTPAPELERCLMIRANHGPDPCFVVPSHYPQCAGDA
ncbi:DUF1853 family protein [Haloferula sp.]|uniref:DUF1853 family protein n=1 Tax=Haloferula sp. TaxID=2497595 RepID=UPI003C75B276